LKGLQKKYNFLYANQYKAKLKNLKMIDKNKEFVLTVSHEKDIDEVMLYKPSVLLQTVHKTIEDYDSIKIIQNNHLPDELIYIGKLYIQKDRVNIIFSFKGIFIETLMDFEERPSRFNSFRQC
jgi:hypothetical protein